MEWVIWVVSFVLVLFMLPKALYSFSEWRDKVAIRKARESVLRTDMAALAMLDRGIREFGDDMSPDVRQAYAETRERMVAQLDFIRCAPDEDLILFIQAKTPRP
jgi:hypothetical protein